MRASSDPGRAGSTFWLIMPVPLLRVGGGPTCRGELSALLEPGFALLGSELAGVGWRSADRLALFPAVTPLRFASECDDRGGEMDSPLCCGDRDGPVATDIDGRTGPCGFLALTAMSLGSIGAPGCCESGGRPASIVRGTDICGEADRASGCGL